MSVEEIKQFCEIKAAQMEEQAALAKEKDILAEANSFTAKENAYLRVLFFIQNGHDLQ